MESVLVYVYLLVYVMTAAYNLGSIILLCFYTASPSIHLELLTFVFQNVLLLSVTLYLFYFLVSLEEVKETVTQKWCKAAVHYILC
jgi:hypothetical protein